MKALPVLLTVSFAANVAGFLAFVVWSEPSAALVRGVFQSERPSSAPATPSATSRGAIRSAGDSAARREDRLAWSDLPAGDFPALAARLRAAGFPPGVVRQILMASLSEHFEARRR